MLLFLGVLKNNWQLAALLVSILTGTLAWKGEHALLLHARTEVARDEGIINVAREEAKREDEAAQALEKQRKGENDELQAQLDSALKAHALTGDALRAALLRYENDRSAGQMCQGSGGAGGNPGHPGHAAGGGANQHVAAAVAALPGACQSVIDELGACQAWAKTVKCQ